MQGLLARTLQCFLQDTYGLGTWAEIARRADLDSPDFEAMLDYEPATVERVLAAAVQRLDKPGEAILEDIGTYLISHHNNEGLRRLMRYGGLDFIDFLHSLEDLPGRARLAVADLDLPELELCDREGGGFDLICRAGSTHPRGLGHVLVGVLRAMADDYGALVILGHSGASAGRERIEITVVQTDFAAGRSFDLGGAPPSPVEGQ